MEKNKIILLYVGIMVLFLISPPPAGASEISGQYSYSLVHISDTQKLSRNYPVTLNHTFSYLESVREEYNITAIIVTGDLVDSWDNHTQWKNYAASRSLTTIPLYEVSGNHDVNGLEKNYSFYNTYIGTGKGNWNAEINDFLFIGIGYSRDALNDSEVDGYTALIESSSHRIPIIATHDYFGGVTYPSPLSPLGTSIKTGLYLRDPTIIMCGHMHGNILHSCSADGKTLIEDMTDYQDYGNFSAGKLYTIDRNAERVFRIAVRDIFLFPSQSTGPEIIVYPARPCNISGSKIAIFRDGLWVIDYNGNFQWDGLDVDRAGRLGVTAGSIPVTGDWNSDGVSELGIFRSGLWEIDYNGNFGWDNSAIDRTARLGQAGDIPVIGDWDGDGKDKIGVFRKGLWVMDYNGDYSWNGLDIDRAGRLGVTAGSIPVTGDWNSDGSVELGIFRDGLWEIDYNGNYGWDGPITDRIARLGQAGDIPVVAGWA